jgi:hypothetical protein
MQSNSLSQLLRRHSISRTALGAATAGVVLLGGTTTALALSASASAAHGPSIHLSVLNPRPHDIAGKRGDFTVLVQADALNATGNQLLSGAHGYKPGLNLPPAATFGPGKPDPDSPGLVVTLSSTPAAAGGAHANLAGVFQLNTVSMHNGLRRVINDWEVGAPGFFGRGNRVTLTAYLARGTAPGHVTGEETRISNVVHETFTIGS